MIGSDMIAHLLDEDVAGGDVTTDALGFGHRAGEMLFKARGPMVVAGIGVARKMMAGLDVALYAADGLPIFNNQGYTGDFKGSKLPFTPTFGGNADIQYQWLMNESTDRLFPMLVPRYPAERYINCRYPHLVWQHRSGRKHVQHQ